MQDDQMLECIMFGMRIYPYNKLCEEETLAILRHYPVLSLVVFNVYTDGE